MPSSPCASRSIWAFTLLRISHPFFLMLCFLQQKSPPIITSWPRRGTYCRREPNDGARDEGTRALATRETQIAGRWWILGSKELLAEVLNFSGLNTDANGDVLPIAEDSNLGGQPHTIPFSQRLGETMGATDRHLNGARVILQREGGIPTLPSQFILARTRKMNFALESAW